MAVIAHRGRSARALIVLWFVRIVMKTVFRVFPMSDRTLPILRAAEPYLSRVPQSVRGVRIEKITLGGVPTERIIPDGDADPHPRAALVYYHGGAFIGCNLDTHRRIAVLLLAVGLWARFELVTPDAVPHETRLEIPPGASYQAILRQLVDVGRLSARETLWLRIEARLTETPQVKAGEYLIAAEQSPHDIRDLLVSGKVILHRIQLVEGWTTQQAIAAVRSNPAIVQELTEAELALDRLMPALELEGGWAEGRLRPDTYAFPKGTTDRAFLRRAALAQAAEIERWWAQRPDDLPLNSADELLILASIIEKETGLPEERFEVAGVFVNRLKLGMRLQTDPTVAYGVAANFSGPLLRKHLDTDTPFNTYTRDGLPPTAICLPGSASLQAAVAPAARAGPLSARSRWAARRSCSTCSCAGPRTAACGTGSRPSRSSASSPCSCGSASWRCSCSRRSPPPCTSR